MHKFTFALSLLLLGSFATAQAVTTPDLKVKNEHRHSTTLILKFIDLHHYKQTHLNDEQSKAIFDRYLKALDPNRSFFTQADILSFEHYKTRLDNTLPKADLRPAFEIIQIYNKRRIERAEFAIKLLESDFDFTRKEEYHFDRSKAEWARNTKELDELWRKRVKNDVLTLLLAKKKPEALKKTLRKRYQRIITLAQQFTAEDTYEIFINTYLSNVEPHTGYFSPRTSENFDIDMSLSLEGIGAALQTEDEFTVVQRIIPGGPADLGGQLHAKDKITGVAQGKDGEMEDVVGWRIDDVVSLIRGPKGSVVRLQIMQAKSGLDGATREITIVRNKVQLEKQQAKKSVIEINDGEVKKRIGVITIPMFYMDFAGYARGDKDYRSTTRDTRNLLKELADENVDGVVIDLRDNGGGSLIEAVSLTGLFIKTGPVVQIREKSGQIDLNSDTNPDVAYTGPLGVLVNRYSASASEIFAGAMQDYGRATIMGEPTYGKGTVQSIVDLNRYSIDDKLNLGKLKLTMAQFFRINGDSTQHRGVIPDIIFPTTDNSDEHGESAEENALPWAQIAPAKYTPFSTQLPSLSDVMTRHQQRVEKDKGFTFLLTQAEERRRLSEQKSLSLEKKKRQSERQSIEVEQNKRLNAFRVSRGLKPVDLDDDSDNEDDDANKNDEKLSEEINRIELREAAHILSDVIRLHENKLAFRKKK